MKVTTKRMLVCDFDSFRTRKDWYMTWRQMKAMADGRFEIGNHSVGHSSGLNAMLTMDDRLTANHVPKPTTIAWPLGSANVDEYPGLVEHGYIFERGGYNRPYRPTVDHPFDIPSMASYNMPDFVNMMRQAVSGRIVVICCHGVPDMEHPPCSVQSAVFKEMMQDLEDNNYRVIALRDLAEYVDPTKTAKLPPTTKEFKESALVVLPEEVKPYESPGNTAVSTVTVNKTVASKTKNILNFQLQSQAAVAMTGATIGVVVPEATDVTMLAPTFTLSPPATARYAYTMAGDDCNLHNNEGQPASPFRTDDW